MRLYEATETAVFAVNGAVCLLLVRRAGLARDRFPVAMLGGAYGCFFMSGVFFLLMALVDAYPLVFSSGDLSWVGGLFFLVTLDLWALHGMGAPSRGKRLAALAGPLAVAACNAAYIRIYPEILLNYLIYAVPTAMLSYTALLSALVRARGDPLRRYHLAVLAMLGACAVRDLYTSLGSDAYELQASLANALLPLALAAMYGAARRGWRA